MKHSCTSHVSSVADVCKLDADHAIVPNTRNEHDTMRLYILISALRLFISAIR